MSAKEFSAIDLSTVMPSRASLAARTASTGQAEAAADGSSFRTSLSLQIAQLQAETVSALIGSTFTASKVGVNEAASGVGGLLDLLKTGAGGNSLLGSASGASGASTGLSASGRNANLFDPESAYRMMTVIHGKEASYKAQFAELSAMKDYLFELQADGSSLGQITVNTDNAVIKTQLASFVSEYNDWTRRFDEDMAQGGLLAETQAAQVSRYELKQSIENIFFGAAEGLHGLADIGLTINPVSKMAELDGDKLEAMLAGRKSALVATVQDFGENFAKSAELLNSDGNFIPNRLNNLDRVIDYITENEAALEEEFGRGDPAKPTGKLAEALAAYNLKYAD